MNNYKPFDGGRTAFYRGELQKPLDDKKFLEYFNSMQLENADNHALRAAKQAALQEWKNGWLAAQEESEKTEKPVAKKKTKTSKKKVSKKKSNK